MKRALILALQTAALCAAAELPTAKPESVGFSSDRLQNLHSLIQNEIDQKQLAGAVTILARHGKVIDYRTYGQRDMEKSVPMTKDTIFRAYSMTKPLTGVAMMILYEQGKWLPWHPISEYIPEFAHLKVFNGFDGSGKMILVDPEHPPTIGRSHVSLGGLLLRLHAITGGCHVPREKGSAIGQSARDDREARHHSAELSTWEPLAVQRWHGHRGLHG